MENFQVEVFFDGDCPLCKREIAFLRRRDRGKQIRFTDIQQLDFQVSTNIDRSFEQMMAEIHGRLPDGTWIQGVEVFRRLYDAIGWRRIVAVTRWPVVCSILDWAYRGFARHRLALTGRCQQSCETNPQP